MFAPWAHRKIGLFVSASLFVSHHFARYRKNPTSVHVCWLCQKLYKVTSLWLFVFRLGTTISCLYMIVLHILELTATYSAGIDVEILGPKAYHC